MNTRAQPICAAFSAVSTSSARARRAIVAQPSVELAALLGVHRCGILRACVVAVFAGIKTEESRHPLVDRAAERTDEDPAVAAFERVVGLKTRRPVAGMPVDRALAGEERQRVAVGLRDRLILREVDHLAPPGLLNLPQRHHRRRPAGERGHVVAGVGLGALRRTRGVAGEVHHAAIRLRHRVIARTPEIVLLAVLPVGADPHDHEARVDRERQLVSDAVAFECAGRRGFHPYVGDLPQRHQELDAARLLEVEPHRQLVFRDFGLVAAVGARPARQCGAVKRNMSPPGFSTWMTSAPNSASLVPI